MQTWQTPSRPPRAPPRCFPEESVCLAAPQASSTMKDTSPVQRSKLMTLCVSVVGYFLLRKNVLVVSTPVFQAFTPLLAPLPPRKPIGGCQWHQMANFWCLWLNIFEAATRILCFHSGDLHLYTTYFINIYLY